MIAFLKGQFVYKSPAVAYMDVQGVGYEVNISLNTYSQIQHLNEGLLHTVLIVREDARLLYGFFEPAEKEMFLHLISVSGVGPSTARIILSYLKPSELARAVIQGDNRTLEAVKGVGKKTAERIVMELKDKMAKSDMDVNILPVKNNTLRNDALNALTALGIQRQAAGQAVDKVIRENPEISVEDLIKAALRSL
ncbi:MAG: Holliday junction branch migration protein RuvA [Chitinophagaceae bacterium]|nr:Holliday junction branch migration protein RuvA [Chitinophagaceae bacterium]